VEEHDPVVPGEPKVGFEAGKTKINGGTKGDDRVFSGAFLVSTMADP
jgi:hypothetical protein